MKKTVLLTLIITAILLSCNDDKTPAPVLCDCAETYGTTAHLGIDEDCPCDATEKPCGCTAKVYGKIADTIPIYRTSGVTDAQATTASAPDGNIQKAYSELLISGQSVPTFLDRIDEIHIKSGSEAERKGKVIEVGIDTEFIDVFLQFYAVATE